MDLVASGHSKNEFVINNELKSAFGKHFNKLKKANDAENITLPFYHLLTDGIWHFKVKPGKQQLFENLKARGGTPSAKALFDVIEFAYLDDELFKYFHNDEALNEIRQALLENLEDLSVQFYRWLLAMGKSERTANSYVGAIKGTISNWAADADIHHQNLIAVQSYSTIHKVAEDLLQYDVFVEKDAIGKQMYSAALKSYENYLADTCQVEAAEDIEKIIENPKYNSSQKAMLVNTRIGQGRFREDLIKYWHGCALTGYQSTQFLVASHIKPWRAANDSERLDKYNGILLLPNLDKAFDLGYISFTEHGNILTSEFIESPKTLGIHKNMKAIFERQHYEYLAYHREMVFENHL